MLHGPETPPTQASDAQPSTLSPTRYASPFGQVQSPPQLPATLVSIRLMIPGGYCGGRGGADGGSNGAVAITLRVAVELDGCSILGAPLCGPVLAKLKTSGSSVRVLSCLCAGPRCRFRRFRRLHLPRRRLRKCHCRHHSHSRRRSRHPPPGRTTPPHRATRPPRSCRTRNPSCHSHP